MCWTDEEVYLPPINKIKYFVIIHVLKEKNLKMLLYIKTELIWQPDILDTLNKHPVVMVVKSKEFNVTKGHNSNTTACWIMPLVLQLCIDMICKSSKFLVDSFKSFWAMGYIKVFFHYDKDNENGNLAISKLYDLDLSTLFTHECKK